MISKNIAFTSLVKLEGRLWEFNFRKQGSNPEVSFHTDFTADRGERLQFLMQRTAQGKWEASGKNLPDWILKGAAKIGRTIEEKTYV